MKRKRFSEDWMIAILKDAVVSAKVLELRCKHDISDATIYDQKGEVRGNDGGASTPHEGARGGERQAQTHRVPPGAR